MNRRRHFHAGGLILALIVLCAAALPAAGQDNFGRGRGRAGSERMLGMRNFVGGLNLTADQRTQIKSILENSKTQILQARRDCVKARLDLAKDLPSAATELANARLQAANLRKQILERIKPVLTPDQLAKVQERQQRREQRLQNMLDRLNGKIGG